MNSCASLEKIHPVRKKFPNGVEPHGHSPWHLSFPPVGRNPEQRSTAESRGLRRRVKGRSSLTGFTLVELLLVIFVIAFLAAVAAPSYNKTLDEAYRRDAKSMLNVIRGAEMIYMSTYNTYTAFTALDDSAREKLLINVYDTRHWEYSVGASGSSATATAIRQAGKHKDNVITIDVGTGTIVQDYSW